MMISDFDGWSEEALAFLDYWQQFDTPFPGTESKEFKEWKEWKAKLRAMEDK